VSFEFTRYDGRRRLKPAVALAVGLSAFAVLFVSLFPDLAAEIDLDAYVESMPPAMRAAFGVRALGTIEGYLATELYSFGWVLLLGLYIAYATAETIAGDAETGRLDILLSLPVTRARLLLERFAALAVPIAVVNLLTPLAVLASVAWIGESVALVDLLVVHAASVPYLLATASAGLLASVAFDRASSAQRVAAGVVFGLYLLESVVVDTEFAWLGALSPTRYYDPTAILVDSQYDPLGSLLLLGATAVMLAVSVAVFRRRDIP
jgi:ABC-2 type transport system permease protein